MEQKDENDQMLQMLNMLLASSYYVIHQQHTQSNVTHRNTWIQHYIETQRYSIPWSLTYEVSLKHSVTSI